MKRYWHIFWMLLCLLGVNTACSDDDDDTQLEVDEEWRKLNDEAFAAQAKDPEFPEARIAERSRLYLV